MASDSAIKQGQNGRGGSLNPPAISLPKGGGAIRGMDEKFAANPVTGTRIGYITGRNNGACADVDLATIKEGYPRWPRKKTSR